MSKAALFDRDGKEIAVARMLMTKMQHGGGL